MRFASAFSGVGMIDLGLQAAGWEPAAQIEIEEDCRAVLARHWPAVRRFNDVREVRGGDLGTAGPVCDLVVGGSPCQDLSLAGRREGLAGERSGLFFELVRLADEAAARWLLWENVFGALSSNGGEDFACVLGAVTGYRPEVPRVGKGQKPRWRNAGICVGPRRAAAWRVLDAQFVGGCPLHARERGIGPVPQRRRRVFLVACLGDVGGLGGAPPGEVLRRLDQLPVEVLFEPDGGDGDSLPGRGKGKKTAATLRSRSASAGVNRPGRGGEDDANLVTHALTAEGADEAAAGQVVGESFHANGSASYREGAPSLAASDDNGTNHLVVGAVGPAVAFDKYNQADTGEVACTLGAGSRRHNNAHLPHVAAADPRHDRPVTVTLLDTATGEVATDARFPAFWWAEGNGICDCNRAAAFGVELPDTGYCHGCHRFRVVACSDAGPYGLADFNRGYPPGPVAYQCHGGNVGPMGTIRAGNGHMTGGVPFIVNAAGSCAKASHARASDMARSIDGTGSFATNQGGTVVAYGIGSDAVDRSGEGKGGTAAERSGLNVVEGCQPSLRARPNNSVAVVPIDMRQASRGEKMTNNRAEGACQGGAPGTGIGEEGDPSPSIAETHTPAVAAFVSARAARGSTTHNEVGVKDGRVADTLQSNDGVGAVVYNPHRTLQKDGSVVEGFKPDDIVDALHGPTGNKEPLVPTAFQERGRAGGRTRESQEDLAYALLNPGAGGRRHENNVAADAAVRRLTPTECERLMGLPDGWTALRADGTPVSDSARYRMIGNGCVRQVIEWIGGRLAKAHRELATLLENHDAAPR